MMRKMTPGRIQLSSALTRAEKRLIRVITELDEPNIPVTHICKKAKISRDKYYKAMKNPEVASAINNLCCLELSKTRPMRVRKFIERTMQGSAVHGKTLFEIEGLIKNEKVFAQQINVNQNTVNLMQTRADYEAGKPAQIPNLNKAETSKELVVIEAEEIIATEESIDSSLF